MEKRDYNFYIDKAKEHQGFKYDNELDSALGFNSAMCCILRKGKAHLSEEKMIQLAELANEPDFMALAHLHIMRSQGPARKTYEKIFQKLQQLGLSILVCSFLFNGPANANIIETNAHYGNGKYTLSLYRKIKKMLLALFKLRKFDNGLTFCI